MNPQVKITQEEKAKFPYYTHTLSYFSGFCQHFYLCSRFFFRWL